MGNITQMSLKTVKDRVWIQSCDVVSWTWTFRYHHYCQIGSISIIFIQHIQGPSHACGEPTPCLQDPPPCMSSIFF